MSQTFAMPGIMRPHQGFLRMKFISLLFSCWFACLAWPPAAFAAPNDDTILQQIGIPADKASRLATGKVVAHELREGSDKELALSTAIYLQASPAAVGDFLIRGDMAAIDPDIIAAVQIPENADISAFKQFSFTAKQHLEIENLLDAEAGDHFNLSTTEINSFENLCGSSANSKSRDCSEAVSRRYREILLQRYRSYREKGLTGIEDYARDGDQASPARELRGAVENSQLLAKYYPALYQGWLNYPANRPANISEHFYCLNRRVEKRPTAILGHRLVYHDDTGTVMVSRQYFVGHSYNSGQLIIGALPYRDGSLVFYRQRTSTDQVAGMASSLKHNIGRSQLKEQMIVRLERLRKRVNAAK